MEKIVQAAIWQDGIMYVGRRHYNIILDMVENYGLASPIRGCQGFVTNTGRFVERDEAAEIAFKAGQVKKQHSKLFSEDLY